MKAVVILAGSGVYDGSEIHESVLTLLALDQAGFCVQCAAPDENQHHVINHLTGEETTEIRNVLVESARIARGQIIGIQSVQVADFDAIVFPGGFGAAKNLSKWAFQGSQSEINPDVKRLIMDFIQAKKPIMAACIAPTLIALALKGSAIEAKITVGDKAAPIDKELSNLGAQSIPVPVSDFIFDEKNKIITTPCYMTDSTIAQVFSGIQKSVQKLKTLIS